MTPTSVVHVTSSALAGAPARLVDALNRYTNTDAKLLRFGKVRDNQRPFEVGAVSFNAPQGLNWEVCTELAGRADVIHVHNQISVEILRLLDVAPRHCRLVFHVHSPPAERPNFFDHGDFLPVEPHLRLVVPHFHPRCYWDYTMIPNVVSAPLLSPIRQAGSPMLMFSPSHRTGGRWNSKSSPAADASIAALQQLGTVDVKRIEAVAPDELLRLRQIAAFSVDEVVTGSYHQVSLEALAVGSVPINNADAFSMACFRVAYQTSEPPPFMITDADGLVEEVRRACADPDELWNRRLQCRDYFERYMAPDRIAQRYADVYGQL